MLDIYVPCPHCALGTHVLESNLAEPLSQPILERHSPTVDHGKSPATTGSIASNQGFGNHGSKMANTRMKALQRCRYKGCARASYLPPSRIRFLSHSATFGSASRHQEQLSAFVRSLAQLDQLRQLADSTWNQSRPSQITRLVKLSVSRH